MKLYTEEELLKAIQLGRNYGGWVTTEPEILKQLTPIEIPSDEDIKSYSDRYSTMHEDVSDKLGKYLVSAIHIDGARWMKEQILGKEDKTFKQKSKWTKI